MRGDGGSNAVAVESIPADQRRLLDLLHGLVRGWQAVQLRDRHHVRGHRPLEEGHVAVGTLEQVEMIAPAAVVAAGHIGAVVVEAPARFGAGERGAGGHLRAVPDERHLHGAHQFVRVAGAHLFDLGAHAVEGLHGDGQFGRRLGWGHIVVDEPPQLVFDLRLRRPIRMPQRPVDQLMRVAQLIVRELLWRRDFAQG